jgi:hypothetical protein
MKLRKMERKVLLVAFALSLALIVVGCGDSRDTTSTNPNANTFNPNGTVNGVLRDAVTNVALVGAKVQIMDRVATTDSSGIFTITNVPALTGDGTNEPSIDNSAYPVVIDMAAINTAITAYNAIATNTVKKAFYPSMAYAEVYVYYTSLGESSDLGYGGGYGGAAANSTNHDTPVDGFVANITPFVGKLDANVKMQVVSTSLVPQSGATVYLFNRYGSEAVQPDTSTGTTSGGSTGAVDGGSPGHLVATQTTDASGYVTFTNIEAKRSFYVKAVIGATQGWWITQTATPPFAVPVASYPSALTAPADNLTDIYGLNQTGYVSTSPELTTIGAYYSVPLVVRTVDGLAPFILSVSPANLSDIAIPATGTVDVVYTFSEPIKNTTPYAMALTRDTSVNGGLYADVAVNYLGPKASNIPYTLAWTDTTHLTISIPVASMRPASRYSVSILNAWNAGAATKLIDANGNYPVSTTTTNTAILFTTAGGFNVAAPVIALSNTSSTAIEWTAITNAASYNVYTEKVGFAVYVLSANVTTFPTYNVASLAGFTLANGVTYNVKVRAVNGAGTESDDSNVINITDVAPAIPTGLARRAAAANVTSTDLDWTASTNAAAYNVYVEKVTAGVGAGYVKANPGFLVTPTTPTASVAAYIAAQGGFNSGQLKVTYNVRVSAVSQFGAESLPTPVASAVVIDDKTGPTAVAVGKPVPPIAISTTVTGTLTVTFSETMAYGDVINPANWSFSYAGATTATVTATFGGTATPITIAGNVATVPWSITTNATGTVAAGAVTVTYAGKDVSGIAMLAGGF